MRKDMTVRLAARGFIIDLQAGRTATTRKSAPYGALRDRATMKISKGFLNRPARGL